MPSYYQSEDLARFSELSKTNPEHYAKYMAWYAHAMEDGALPSKVKKLIALAAAFAIDEPYCIDSYAKQCLAAGFSPEEMGEAANVVAAIRGGGVVAHWVQACNTLEREE
ncbi:MAG: carboxymuconolactone decarboxylase family protein [Myxococcales bacterium]|nr:carboxymuconolactone decarboxylase family protein [Myxococcales bacterium]MCB9650262.1 carboxymuconolactone decarboxylase family protein [Deltaproteobacteria bacterium]